MPIPPLLIVPFLAYNLMALGLGGNGMSWNTPLVALALPSGEAFRYTFGDVLVLVALVLLIASPHLRPIKRTPLGRAAMLAVPLAYAGNSCSSLPLRPRSFLRASS